MSDENLGDVLDESYRKHKREVALRNLGERTHLTLEKLALLVGHETHGETVKDITLQELIDVGSGDGASSKPPSSKPPSSGTAAKKPAAKPAAKKATAKKAAKKAAKKGAKKAAKKATAKKGPKADKGKPKPRLDYETGKREVLAAVKAAGKPVGRSDIEKATGYTGVQVRTFAKALQKDGKVAILGQGGRSTAYTMPG
jgi:hypothetical protein